MHSFRCHAAAIIVCPLFAEERGQQRYIVVIRRQRFGPPPTPDIARLGGTIESRQDDQLVVTIPARALAALKGDPAVLYLERVGGTPDDESPLIGAPADPQPGTPSKRFTPPRWVPSPGTPAPTRTTARATSFPSVPTTTFMTASSGSNSPPPRDQLRRTLTTASAT
jgi:hypothetical protein